MCIAVESSDYSRDWAVCLSCGRCISSDSHRTVSAKDFISLYHNGPEKLPVWRRWSEGDDIRRCRPTQSEQSSVSRRPGPNVWLGLLVSVGLENRAVCFYRTSLCSASFLGRQRDTARICCSSCGAVAVEHRRLLLIDIFCLRGSQQQTHRTRLLLSIDRTDGRSSRPLHKTRLRAVSIIIRFSGGKIILI